MLLYIDPRAGSNKLPAKFQDEYEEMFLEGGDVAFWGNGPGDEPWFIGIEYKQLDDIVACIKSGRLTGTQLPKMMKLFDLSFLLVEGIPRPDRASGQLVRYRGKAVYGMGLSFQAFDNFLTSVNVFSSLAGKPCIVKMASTEYETVKMIRDMYELFQKPWDSHKAMSRPDLTKIQHVAYDLEVLKVPTDSPEYPQYLLRKALFQIQGIGWDVAGTLAKIFRTMEGALAASQKDWEAIERVGKGLAKRAFFGLHGYDDPESAKRKKGKPDGESKQLAVVMPDNFSD